MTEISRPWAGTTIGDAGPYTAPNWWDVWQAFTRSHGAKVGAGNRGVFYVVPGRLAPTSPGINTVRIAAGAALVDGLYYENTANVDVTIPSATAGKVRDDRVVIRKTYSALTQTARIVRLVGSEAASPGPGTPPALTQDTTRTTFWDTPLCRVSVTDAGAITITDERHYVGEYTATIAVPVVPYLGGTVYSALGGGVVLADAATCAALGNGVVPRDFIGNAVLHVLAVHPAVGCAGLQWYLYQEGNYGANDTSFASNNWVVNYRQVSTALPAAGNEARIPACSVNLTNAAAGDWFESRIYRDGAHVSDTCNKDLIIMHNELEYLAVDMPD